MATEAACTSTGLLHVQEYLDRINLLWTINETLPSGNIKQFVEAFLIFEQSELHQHPSFTLVLAPACATFHSQLVRCSMLSTGVFAMLLEGVLFLFLLEAPA